MTSKRQAAFLRRMFAERRAASRRHCDCSGICPTETCGGFTPGCTCDESPSIREALGLPAISTTVTKDHPAEGFTPPPDFPF